jgi:hypothetical protein
MIAIFMGSLVRIARRPGRAARRHTCCACIDSMQPALRAAQTALSILET